MLFTVATGHAAEQNVNPGINRHYQDASFDKWARTFERPGREVYDKRHDVIRALGLKPGMDVADVGAGTGFYSLLFAQQLGQQGKVYAVDISENFIKNILRRADEMKLNNIHGIVSSQTDTHLQPASVDLVYICATYHHFEYPQTMLASMYRALRPGGQLVIIDFRKQADISSAWVMSHVRGNKQAVINEVEQAGFKFHSEAPVLKTYYFIRFEKTDGK
jgi:ubiquinone/menaquinone biosynthesis C-methylase UbiE